MSVQFNPEAPRMNPEAPCKNQELDTRKKVLPVSGSSETIRNVAIAAIAIFAASIVLWAVGAQTGAVALEIIGKVVFSLCIVSGAGLVALASLGICNAVGKE